MINRKILYLTNWIIRIYIYVGNTIWTWRKNKRSFQWTLICLSYRFFVLFLQIDLKNNYGSIWTFMIRRYFYDSLLLSKWCYRNVDLELLFPLWFIKLQLGLWFEFRNILNFDVMVLLVIIWLQEHDWEHD